MALEHYSLAVTTNASIIKQWINGICDTLNATVTVDSWEFTFRFTINGENLTGKSYGWGSSNYPTQFHMFIEVTDGNVGFLWLCGDYRPNYNEIFERAGIMFAYVKDINGAISSINLSSNDVHGMIYHKWNVHYLANVVTNQTDILLLPAMRDNIMFKDLYVCPNNLFTAGLKYSDGTNTFMSLGYNFFVKIS